MFSFLFYPSLILVQLRIAPQNPKTPYDKLIIFTISEFAATIKGAIARLAAKFS